MTPNPTENPIPDSGCELIVVSDIHLRDGTDERAELLLGLLRAAQKRPVHTFILLGDIFDFCFGATPYFKKKFASLGYELSALGHQGTNVLFFEGNHEFDLKKLAWPGVDFVSSGDRLIELPSGLKIKAAHGDLVYSTLLYRVFRGVLKSRVFRFLGRFVPQPWLDAYALSHASISRAQDGYRELDHKALLQCVKSWMGSSPHLGLIGHFHVPYNEPLDNDRRLISVQDWSAPNFLMFENDQVWRGHVKEGRWCRSLAEITNYV